MTKHFHDILIITRSTNNFVLEGAPDFSHLGELINWKEPQEDDVQWAIKQLNVNKAADSLGLQAEMFKACVKHEKGKTFELVGLMTQTLQRLWKGEEVPTSWLVPCTKEKAHLRIGIIGVALSYSTLHPRYMPSCSTER